jgi:hypothetical protein
MYYSLVLLSVGSVLVVGMVADIFRPLARTES